MSKTCDSARFQSAYEIKKANFAIFFIILKQNALVANKISTSNFTVQGQK
jgi:hypothetical protein